MLESIRINNIGIIEELTLDLKAGFQVITGATGSGKSMFLQAIDILRGSKVSKDLIRKGASKASVEIVFSFSPLSQNLMYDYLQAEGFLSQEEEETSASKVFCSIYREIKANGYGLCRLNGQLIKLEQLREFSAYWIDFQSQGESRLLYTDQSHGPLLDTFLRKQTQLDEGNKFLQYEEAYKKYKSVVSQKKEMSMDEQKRLEMLDFTEYQIAEIEKVKPKLGEDEELSKKLKIFQAKEKLATTFNKALISLTGGDEEESSILGVTRASSLIEQSPFQGKVKDKMLDLLNEAVDKLEEASSLLENTLEQLKWDPEEYEDLLARQDAIFHLQKKYGPKLMDVLEFYKQKKELHEKLLNAEEMLRKLEIMYQESWKEVEKEGLALRKLRQEGAKLLEQNLKDACERLHMKSASLRVHFDFLKEYEAYAYGLEKIFFEVEMNNGEGFKSLARSVSGGEAARLMLALKYILLATKSTCPSDERLGEEVNLSTSYNQPLVIIFDEIDAGVSGEVAHAVGEMMYKMSKVAQVICVTHSPTIAAQADNHYKIYKEEQNGRVYSFIKHLDFLGKVDELSILLSGRVNDNQAKELAESLLLQNSHNKQ